MGKLVYAVTFVHNQVTPFVMILKHSICQSIGPMH
uniref:Uncharacterized protein n=1 Tax=Anguilla anguilla TaxID=7936 RepID=A0A0E9PWT1_ANGAN